MVAQVVAAPIVKALFTYAVRGLFGAGGNQVDPNSNFGRFFADVITRGNAVQNPPLPPPGVGSPVDSLPPPPLITGGVNPKTTGYTPRPITKFPGATPPISSAQTGGGFPLPNSLPGYSIPDLLPAIPGFGSVLSRILGAGIAGWLLYPRAAGQGSDLRDLYGVPNPKPRAGTRGRRRRRVRARPIARPTNGNPFPAVPKGRGGPKTISRPGVAVLTPPKNRVAVLTPPKNPRPLPPPLSIPQANAMPRPAVLSGPLVIPRSLPSPGQMRIPTVSSTRALPAVSSIPSWVAPLVRVALPGLLAQLGARPSALTYGLPAISPAVPGIAPGIGPITSPLAFPSPLTALQPSALTSASPWAVPRTATQEQDCSCRPARKKRKGKPCKNPVKSSRRFVRDGKRFVTTTKEIKCQASSRKKPRLRLAP